MELQILFKLVILQNIKGKVPFPYQELKTIVNEKLE
jgi:hypothetical protein